MQLSVEILRETCRNGIEIAKRDQQEWDENVAAAEAAWELDWKENKVEQWRVLRDKITKALRTGAPITESDLGFKIDHNTDDRLRERLYRPFNRGRIKDGWNDQWVADHNFGRRPVLKIRGFEALIEFLHAVTDKTISTTQLERAGFRNMHKLFEAAANGVWE